MDTRNGSRRDRHTGGGREKALERKQTDQTRRRKGGVREMRLEVEGTERGRHR